MKSTLFNRRYCKSIENVALNLSNHVIQVDFFLGHNEYLSIRHNEILFQDKMRSLQNESCSLRADSDQLRREADAACLKVGRSDVVMVMMIRSGLMWSV